ncbi:MAG: prolyl oligopeptidase family serine peptidase [Chloroflexota bacterium]
MRVQFKTIGVLLMVLLLQSSILHAQDYGLPEPTGPYAIGITSFHWVDESREETFTPDDPDDRREVVVDVWYPATVAEGAETAPYMPDPVAFRDGLQDAFHEISPHLDPPLDALTNMPTHSYADAPLSDEQASYPVLIFSHGIGASSRMYTSQTEALASHGYIVASINHPYTSAAVTFPDGRTTMLEFDFGSSLAQAAQLAADQSFVLDQLELLNAGEPESLFSGRLDLERVGVFGHSAGGNATALTFTSDSRFKAAINEDGSYVPAARTGEITYPLMHMASEDFSLNMRTFSNYDAPVYNLTFNGFGHTDFTDFLAWGIFPLHGTVDRARALEITNAYIVAFFDQALKGEPSPLLSGASADYPEVDFQSNAP